MTIPVTTIEPNETKSKGDVYEGVAFNFCKVATVLLLLEILRLGRWALPIVSGIAALLYLTAHIYGTRSSRCVLKKPLIIAAFWLVVAGVWLYRHRV
jgi:hypothetical protein